MNVIQSHYNRHIPNNNFFNKCLAYTNIRAGCLKNMHTQQNQTVLCSLRASTNRDNVIESSEFLFKNSKLPRESVNNYNKYFHFVGNRQQ